MNRFAIRSDRIVCPHNVDAEGYLLVEDGLFKGLTEVAPDGAEIVDRRGCWVAPGLVDTHIHGFAGHDVMDCDPAGVNEICRELARAGTTSWLATTLTASVEETGKACASVAEALRLQDDDFCGARIRGIFLEGPFFTEEHKGAQNPKYLIDPALETLDAWQKQAGGLIRKSALAPEREGSLDYIRGLSERAVVGAIGHSSASYEQCLAAIEAGASAFVHTYNGMDDLFHRAPGPVGAAMTTPDSYSELICDGHHVHPGACGALIAAKGYEHVALITDCLACGGLPDGEYAIGELPIVLRKGEARLRESGNLAGSTLTLAKAVGNVVAWGLVDASQALRMAGEIAARSARIIDRCGLIKEGRQADLAIFDDDLVLQEAYVGGRVVA